MPGTEHNSAGQSIQSSTGLPVWSHEPPVCRSGLSIRASDLMQIITGIYSNRGQSMYLNYCPDHHGSCCSDDEKTHVDLEVEMMGKGTLVVCDSLRWLDVVAQYHKSCDSIHPDAQYESNTSIV